MSDLQKLLDRAEELAQGLIEDFAQLKAITHDSEFDLDALKVAAIATFILRPALVEIALKASLSSAFFLGWKAREGVGDLSAFEEDNNGS